MQLWVFLYAEVAVTWIVSSTAFYIAMKYLRGGRVASVSERYRVILRARDSLVVYTVYWIVTIVFYCWAIAYPNEQGTQFHDGNVAAVGFCFVFSARGLVTFTVRWDDVRSSSGVPTYCVSGCRWCVGARG